MSPVKLQAAEGKTLDSLLKSGRDALGLSQDGARDKVNQLAVEKDLCKLGEDFIPRSTYSQYEHGKVADTDNVRRRLAVVFEALEIKDVNITAIIQATRATAEQTAPEDDAPDKPHAPFKLLMEAAGVSSPELAKILLGDRAQDADLKAADFQFRRAKAGARIDQELADRAVVALKRIAKDRGMAIPDTPPVHGTLVEKKGKEAALSDLMLMKDLTITFDTQKQAFVDQHGNLIITRDAEGPYVKVRIDPKRLRELIPEQAFLDAFVPKGREK